jgi:hypothetical protein
VDAKEAVTLSEGHMVIIRMQNCMAAVEKTRQTMATEEIFRRLDWSHGGVHEKPNKRV